MKDAARKQIADQMVEDIVALTKCRVEAENKLLDVLRGADTISDYETLTSYFEHAERLSRDLAMRARTLRMIKTLYPTTGPSIEGTVCKK